MKNNQMKINKRKNNNNKSKVGQWVWVVKTKEISSLGF